MVEVKEVRSFFYLRNLSLKLNLQWVDDNDDDDAKLREWKHVCWNQENESFVKKGNGEVSFGVKVYKEVIMIHDPLVL